MKQHSAQIIYATTVLLMGILCLSFVRGADAVAGINRQINFQGKLVQGSGASAPNTNVSDGTYSVVFTIYDRSSGGTALWSETQTVTTTDGIFRVALGAVTPLPASFNFNWDGLYLGIKVGSDSEMTPRIQFSAVPYAFNAEKVSGLTVQDDAGNASTSGILRVANGKTITFGDAFSTTGGGITLTASGTTNVSLPNTGAITLVDTATGQTLTNKIIGSSGLTFSGAAIDITTALNEALTLTPAGTGNVVINPNAGGQAGLVIDKWGDNDIFTASKSGITKFVINSSGNVGIGTNNPQNLFTVTSIASQTSTKSALMSVDQMALSQLEGGAYFGRVGLTESKFGLNNYGATWTARDSSRNWTGVAMSSDGKVQTAIANGGQIYTSTDYGVTWTARDSSRFWAGVAMSSDGKIQTATDNSSGKIYTSTDYGATWTARDSSRNWTGVAMSSDGEVQTAVVNTGLIYSSTDYGVTWTARDSSRSWTSVAMSSDGKVQTAGTNGGQIYTSTDYGATWTARDSSRSWTGIAMSSDGKVQTAIVNGGQIYTSTDYGATWTARDSSRTWKGVAMSSDGKIQTAVTTGLIYTSTDYGATWAARESSRFWQGVAMSSDGKLQTAVNQNGKIYTSSADTYLSYGNLGIGTTTPTAGLDIQGSGIAAQTGTLLNVAGSSIGKALVIFNQPGDQDIFTASSSGVSKFTIANNGNVGIGSTAPASTLYVNGTTTGNSALTIVQNTSNGDLFTASAGATPKFTVTYAGGIMLGNSVGTNSQCIVGGTTASWGTCGSGGASTFTINSNGTISPINNTADFLYGGSATTSAKFALLNINPGNGNNPVASISAQTGTYTPALSLSSDGIIQTVNRNTLTIGGNSTGNVILIPGNGTGFLSIGTSTTPAFQFDLTQSSSKTLSLGIDGTADGILKLFSSGAGKTAPSVYADSTGNLNVTAPSGTVKLGSASSGNINFHLNSAADVLVGSKIVNLAAAYSGITDFTFKRTLTGGINNQGGTLFSITDTSGGTGTINPDLLVVNSALTSGYFTGNLARFQLNGIDIVKINSVGTNAGLTISPTTSYAALTAINNGVGDLFTASAGATTKFRIANDGTLSLYGATSGVLSLKANASTTNYTLTLPGAAPSGSNYALVSNNSGTGSWLDTSALGTNYWDQLNGGSTLLPKYASVADLLLGGTSSSSAKFAFLNNAGVGTPTASISAQGGTNNAFYITANGKLATTNKQNLTIGDTTTTGNILLTTGGNVGIGTTTPISPFHLTRDISNGATGKALAIFDQSEDQNIFTASAAGVTKFIIQKDGNVGIGTNTASTQLRLVTTPVTGFTPLPNWDKLVIENGTTGGAGAVMQLVSATDGVSEIGFSDTTRNVGLISYNHNQSYLGFSVNSSERVRIDGNGNVGIGTTASNSTLYVAGQKNGARAATIIDQLATGTGSDIFSASSSGNTKFVISNNGNVGIGTNAPLAALDLTGDASMSGDLIMDGAYNGSHSLDVLNGNSFNIRMSPGGDTGLTTAFSVSTSGNMGIGTTAPNEKLNVEGGNILIGAQPNSSQSQAQDWTKITQAAGTIASGGTASIASASATAVYNGSLYVGTGKTGNAEVYRYMGSGTNWTKVSGTTGTIGGGATTAIDSISSMAVYNGYLYAGTSKLNSAEIYRYDGSSTWTKISGTAGTVGGGATTAIDGITALVVYHGALYAGTSESTKAEIYRYDGGTTWTKVTGTAGTIGTSTLQDTITSMAVYNNALWAASSKANNNASLYRYIQSASTTTWLQETATLGQFTINGANVTAFASINTMGVFEGALIIAAQKTGGAELLRYEDTGANLGTTANPNFTRLGASAGQLQTGGTSAIDGVMDMVTYNGKLYVGTTKSNGAEIYRYEGTPGAFTKVSGGAAGNLDGPSATSNIDGVAELISYNGTLYAGTFEPNGAEIYTYQYASDQSYALKFNASNSQAGGQQDNQLNLAQISYVASPSASSNMGRVLGGQFLFSHGIMTSFGAYDVAEDYPTRDESIAAGDVVTIDPNERGFVQKSSKAYDAHIVGVFSEKPGFELSQQDSTIDGGIAIPVALVGRVPVNVSTENGEIKPGDYLTTSSQPGVAMKASKAGGVLGKALEGYNGNGVGKVLVFVTIANYTGDSLNQLAGLRSTSTEDIAQAFLGLAAASPASESAQTNNTLSDIVTDRLAAGVEIMTPKVSANIVRLDHLQALTSKDVTLNLSPDGEFIISDTTGSPAITFDNQGNGVFSGTITAKNIKADQIEGLDILVQNIRFGNNGSSVLSASTSAGLTMSSQASSSQNLLTSLITNTNQSSSTSTNLTTITNKSVTLESLNVSGMATISASMRVKGDSLVEGILSVVDSITTKRLVIFDLATFFGDVVFKHNVQFAGRPTFNNDTAGFVVIKKGAQKVAVTFATPYETSPIVTASIDLDTYKTTNGKDEDTNVSAERILSANYSFVITNKTEKGFSVILNKEAEDDIRLSWSAIAVTEAKTTQGVDKLFSPTPTPVVENKQESVSSPSAQVSVR